MKQIQLTQGLVALVDDTDFEWLNQWKWHALKHRDTFYAARNSGGRLNRKYIFMHRLILGIVDSKIEVDHEDLNGLNNSRSNLRQATRSQNAANIPSRKNSSSKYLGVYWDKSRQKWAAAITKNYKKTFLGYFENEHEAATAYNKAATEIHAEFANLNKVAA
jgi:hypothetical protein